MLMTKIFSQNLKFVIFHQKRFFVKKLQERGLIKQLFPDGKQNQGIELINKSKPQTFYAGFDATADSLHLGNLITLITLIHILREGHRVICVIGGATALIGDPSGKSNERKQLTEEEVERNSVQISSDINKIFSNHFKYFWKKDHRDKHIHEPIILNNKSWYDKVNVIDYVSSIGRNLRVGEMLTRSSVKQRMESMEGLSLAEFMYQSFQSNDWLYLHDRYNCNFQVGGSDQTGNIETGYLLLRKLRSTPSGSKVSNKEAPSSVDAYGLLTPLIVNEKGEKIGKSDDGQVIYLNRNKLSPFDFYQHFIRLKDTQISQYLKLFTFYGLSEIEGILDKFYKKPASRSAHNKLAEHVTTLVHGVDGFNLAIKASKALYETKDSQAMLNAIKSMSYEEMKEIFGSNLITKMYLNPVDGDEDDIYNTAKDAEKKTKNVISKSSDDLSNLTSMTMLELSMEAKCFENISDAGRIIKAGGFHVNQTTITDPDMVINVNEHILPNDCTLIRVGKKRFHLIKWR